MGLDMFAYRTQQKLTAAVDFELPESSSEEELAYWRKFNNLHGWMERLYREKGGQKEHFNVTPVQLTLDDLTQLESDAGSGQKLDPTAGFFFGELEPYSAGMKQEILDFIEKARTAINNGYSVYYTSWW